MTAFHRIHPGHTIAEVLAIFSITALISTLALPAFHNWIQSARIRGHTNDLLTQLHNARAEAIRRQTTVMVCESRDHLVCTGNNDWSDGWITFVDVNDNSRPDRGETLLRTHQGSSTGVRITFNGAGRNGDRWIKFRPTGTAKNGTFTLCDRRGAAAARAVIVYRTGRPRASLRGAGNRLLRCED